MVFEPLLDMAEAEKLPIHWGSRGFSLNLDYDGNEIALCFGYPQQTKPNQTSQSLYTAFSEVARKVEGAEGLIKNAKQRFLDTGVFIPAGKNEVKYVIHEIPAHDLVEEILELMHYLIREVGLLVGSD